MQREFFGGDKETLFRFAQVRGLARDARGEVEHQSGAGVALGAEFFHQQRQGFETHHLCTVR